MTSRARLESPVRSGVLVASHRGSVLAVGVNDNGTLIGGATQRERG